jgi:uncharacterized membrane protein HdeD (DUF308 family)
MLHIKKSRASVSIGLKSLVLTGVAFVTFYAQLAFADAPSAATMLENFSETVPQFMQMVTAMAYVLGMFFIYRGVTALKAFGESRTQMSRQHELKGPIVLMTVGTLLLYLPTSVQSGLSTFWTDANPYGYVDEAPDQWSALYQDCFMVIQLIGTVSFIRGLVIMSHLSEQSSQPGTLGRGVTHIIAGILCINLYDFLNAIATTLGVSFNLTNISSS